MKKYIHKPVTDFILLKNGKVLKCTSAQKERINQAIMSTHEFQKIQVKLDGVYFKLGDMEDDVEKWYKAAGMDYPKEQETT